MNKAQTKHKNLVELVKQDLKTRHENKYYFSISTNIEQYNNDSHNECLFEIDDLAIHKSYKKDYVLLFEVKGNKNRDSVSKAKKQLDREEAYINNNFPNKRVFKFMVFGNSKDYADLSYHYEWYKNE